MFVGLGVYIVYWMGDNKVMWEDLKYFVVSVINLGMFGVLMVGVDICGFVGNIIEEFCSCWM